MTKITKASLRKLPGRLAFELLMIIIACVVAIPMYYMIVTTFKTPHEAAENFLGLPQAPTFATYIKVWNIMNYPKVFLNNLIITVVSVILIILITSMAAYAIARRRTRFNKFIYFLFISGLMIPIQMLILPLYRIVFDLHLINKLPGVILVCTAINIPFAIFLFTGFIMTIPKELEEAAQIDGAGPFRVFFSVVFPLLKPVIATVAILDSLSVWNDFLIPLLFLQSRKNSVILLEVFRNIGQFYINWTQMFPMLVLGVAPLLIFYIFMQRYIIQGVVAGAIKQ